MWTVISNLNLTYIHACVKFFDLLNCLLVWLFSRKHKRVTILIGQEEDLLFAHIYDECFFRHHASQYKYVMLLSWDVRNNLERRTKWNLDSTMTFVSHPSLSPFWGRKKGLPSRSNLCQQSKGTPKHAVQSVNFALPPHHPQ